MRQIGKDEIIIYGKNPIKEAINCGFIKHIFLLNSFNDSIILNLLQGKHISYEYISNREMESIVKDGVHQGIAGIRKPFSYISLEEVISKADDKEHPIIVMLDGIEDPHNLGAILRSCDIFDVGGVIIPKFNSATLNATVAKTSAGAINYIPVCMVSNLNNTISVLKEKGYWVVSTDGCSDINFQDIKYDFKTVLVIGSEGKGVSKLVLKNSDYIVKIPQYGHVNSLNASVACGILLSKIKVN